MMSRDKEMNRRKNPEPDINRQNYKDKIIAKAKETLMNKFDFTEPEAHKYIQKRAMDSGTDMIETCEMIILLFEESD